MVEDATHFVMGIQRVSENKNTLEKEILEAYGLVRMH
jgi:hypothetical protein